MLVSTLAPAWVHAKAGDLEGEPSRAAIQAVLEQSATAWSHGDLDAFMRCYEDGPATAYVSRGSVTHGFKAIHDMYAARFAKPRSTGAASMGTLSTTLIDFRALGASYALVHGRFALERPAAARASGVFTLVFHKSTGGWRIISDHTS